MKITPYLRLIPFVILLGSNGSLLADTVLSGNINNSQTLSGKVRIVGLVSVNTGVSLTFLEGTAVMFEPGAIIRAGNSTTISFNGTDVQPIEMYCTEHGKNWGKVEVVGTNATLRVHFVNSIAGQFRVMGGASGTFEDSYFHDYYQGDNAIIYSEDAASVTISRCSVSNYYEINLVRTPSVVEDSFLQFMIGDGIDMDNSPQGSAIRRTTLRYGRGFNIDAIDFGKVNFTGPGSMGEVNQVLVYGISDKGTSVGEGAQDVEISNSVFMQCGAGVAVKDNSFARVFNCIMYNNDYGMELVEKNSGLGGGHGYFFNSISWMNGSPFFLNNTATVQYRFSDIGGLMPDPSRNIISQDPLFLNPARHDFRFPDISPCTGADMNGLDLGPHSTPGCPFRNNLGFHLGVPNPASILNGGESTDIYWSSDSTVSTLRILFSDDSGNSWTTVAAGVDASQLQYVWNVPDIYSSRCRIRLVSEQNPAVYTENYMDFAIQPTGQAAASPIFSLAPGFYNSPQLLTISSSPGDIVYYTLDGSDPTDRSPVFSAPISLNVDSVPAGQPEQDIQGGSIPHQPWSYIRTAPVSQIGPNQAYWNPPTGSVFKGHVVKARVYHSGQGLGPVETASYFIHPQMQNGRYTLPVVSLSTDPENLFDYYNGIYIPGTDFTGYSFTGNYERKGRSSEKPAHIEYFDANGQLCFSQNVGLRVRGEWIRSLGQKALTIYARSEYDDNNKFDYPLFPSSVAPGNAVIQQQYKRFILRNNGNEWGGPENTMCRDALMQSFFNNLNLQYQACSMSILFLDGEYWGIHPIRELIDGKGLKYTYGVDEDSLILMENNLDGPYHVIEGNETDQQEFLRLRDFVWNTDLTIPANYDSLCSMLDMDNFMDYWIATIYSNKSNTDHNMTYWKVRNGHPGPFVSPPHDGKWRFVANDFDAGFIDPDQDNFAWMLVEVGDSLLNHLVRVPEFASRFANRFADVLNSAFSAQYLWDRTDAMEQLLQPEMQEHIDRWTRPQDMAGWHTGMDRLKDFTLQRPGYQFSHIRQQLNLDDTTHITLNVNDPLKGYITINTISVRPTLAGVSAAVYPWTGTYFKNLPVRLTAHPYAGYRFMYWQENGDTNAVVDVNLQGDETHTAVFQWDPRIVVTGLNAYPVPATGNLLRLSRPDHVYFYTMDGRLVLESRNTDRINISGLGSGVYLLKNEAGDELKLVRM